MKAPFPAFPDEVLDCLADLEPGHAGGLHLCRLEGLAVKRLFPPLPAGHSLVIGHGVDNTLKHLKASGIDAHGLAPETSSLEDQPGSGGPWQALVFHECTQTVDSIDLFDHASRLLGLGGHLLVLDAFVLRRDPADGEKPLYFIDHFLRLAERFGFVVVQQEDWTAQAAQTLAWRLDALRHHAPTLKTRFGLDAQAAQVLAQQCQDMQHHFAQGRQGYRALSLKRQHAPRWRLGRIVGERSNQMRALFGEVFGHPMSEAHWHWKYGEGRGQGIGVWQLAQSDPADDAVPTSAQLVAHYGGTTREVLCFGKAVRAFQACDLMVAPGARRALTRQGPVFLVAATFLEHELGYGARHLLGIGFPNERAYRAPVHLGLYRDVLARIHEVHWPALHTRPSLRHGLRELHASDPDANARMDACWACMQASLRDFIVGVRNAHYLRHRYFEHPDHTYRMILVQSRLSGQAQGLLVLRRLDDGSPQGPRCELLDAVGALSSMPVLVHHARRVAAQWGCTRLFAWLAGHLLPHFCLPLDARSEDLGVLVPGNAWTEGPSVESLINRWWLTGGDTDFH